LQKEKQKVLDDNITLEEELRDRNTEFTNLQDAMKKSAWNKVKGIQDDYKRATE